MSSDSWMLPEWSLIDSETTNFSKFSRFMKSPVFRGVPLSHGEIKDTIGQSVKTYGDSCRDCFISLSSTRDIWGQRGSGNVWWRNPNLIEMLPPADPEECFAPCAPGRGVWACQVHRWTCPWVEIQVSTIIRSHATRRCNRTAQSRAQTTQR